MAQPLRAVNLTRQVAVCLPVTHGIPFYEKLEDKRPKLIRQDAVSVPLNLNDDLPRPLLRRTNCLTDEIDYIYQVPFAILELPIQDEPFDTRPKLIRQVAVSEKSVCEIPIFNNGIIYDEPEDICSVLACQNTAG